MLFWNLKSENYSVLIWSVQFWNFLHPTLLLIPLPVFFIYLQLASMIPWILAATVKVIFLNFIIIIFYSVQVMKLKNKPSYISNRNLVNLFVKHINTLASFAWHRASAFVKPCPNLIIVSKVIVQKWGWTTDNCRQNNFFNKKAHSCLTERIEI